MHVVYDSFILNNNLSLWNHNFCSLVARQIAMQYLDREVATPCTTALVEVE